MLHTVLVVELMLVCFPLEKDHIVTDNSQSGHERGCLCHCFHKPPISLVCTEMHLWSFETKMGLAELPKLSILGAQKPWSSMDVRH